MTPRQSDRPARGWLPLPRRARPPALETPVELRPAPVTATPGKAGSAVRAAMQRLRSAADGLQPEEPTEGRAALDEALADLEREIAVLLKTTTQELARARRREREAVELDVRVSALRHPRRSGSSGA